MLTDPVAGRTRSIGCSFAPSTSDRGRRSMAGAAVHASHARCGLADGIGHVARVAPLVRRHHGAGARL